MTFTGTLGHEFVGTVVKLGKGVAHEWMGKRACAEINCVCGKCDMCSRGLSTHCTRRTVIGILNRNGAFADSIAVPVRNLHAVPEHVTDEEAVFVEPLAAAFQILRQIPIEKRTRATVLGDGRLGQLCAQVLARTGCTLMLVGHHEDKLSLAEKLCLPKPAGKATAKTGPQFRVTLERDLRGTRDQDVVIDCTGRAEGFERALTLVRPRGTIVLKTTVATAKPLNLAPIVIDEITILGSRCGPFAEALHALAAREVQVLPLVSKRVTLEQAEKLFAPGVSIPPLKTLIRIKE
jgi:threonine dehydrogenase-like Zn-dependent dehydrogenase